MCAHAIVHMGIRRQLAGLSFLFPLHWLPEDRVQVIRLGGGCIYPLNHLTARNIPQNMIEVRLMWNLDFCLSFFFVCELKVKEKSHVVLGLGPGLSVRWASILQQTSLPGRSLWECHYSVMTALHYMRGSVNQVLLVPAFAVGTNLFSEWSLEGSSLWWNWLAWKGLQGTSSTMLPL